MGLSWDASKNGLSNKGSDKGACTVVEGAVENDCEKNGGELEGSYTYDAENDCYSLEPIGTEESRSFILCGNLYRELLPHQVEGIKWLWGIHCRYFGAIVADDMGMGKTYQATVFLSGLFRSNLISRVIIIVPLSVLGQWPVELKRASIENLVHTYYNCDDTGLNRVLKNGGILLTTYDTYGKNFRKLMGSSKSRWDYAILDEAHKIKNIQSVTRGLVTKIESSRKILLTGTPLQKDLMDLYSLMDFINPGLLGDVATFRKKYLCPIKAGKYANASEDQKEEYRKAIEHVGSIIATYVLRRNKDLLIDGGQLCCKKNDMVIWLRLTELQINLYRKFEHIFSKRNEQDKKSGLVKTSIWQSICNSPSVLLNTHDDIAKAGIHKRMKDDLLDSFDVNTFGDEVNSCKTTFVVELIKEIFEEEKEEKEKRDILKEEKKGKEKVLLTSGATKTRSTARSPMRGRSDQNCEEESSVCKILVFSRSIIMLNAIQKCLNHFMEEDEIVRIDGSIKKERRDELIESFKLNHGPRIFLLSAKVGGEGLNLTAATRVIIIDPSWNSSDDDQISDRVYRMGQKKDVYIYRLVTCRTVEEHTYKTQLLKGALGRGLIEGTLCASSVYKKEGKVLCLPDPEVGFDSSETYNLLESTKANTLGFDGRHLAFLRSHRLVAGITNQNFVFSKDETSRSDLLQEESDADSDIEIGRETQRAKPLQLNTRTAQMPVTSRYPSKKKDVESKQQDLTTGKMTAQMPVTSCHVMEIPENKVGLLIGTDGQTLENIRWRSSATISVEKRRAYPSSSQRSVKITGTIKEIEKAKQMILDAIYEVEQKFVSEACESLKSGEEEEYLYVQQDLVGTIIGKHGRTVIDIRQKSGAIVEYDKNKKGFRLAGNRQQINCATDLINKIIDKTEKYVFVPEDMIGLVIGRNGRKLTEMKQKSGASIQCIHGQNKFLLTGQKQEVDNAEALILEIINRPRGRISGGAIAGSDGYQRRGVPPQPVPPLGNRSQYYGERGPQGPI